MSELATKTMPELRTLSAKLLSSIVIEAAKIKEATVNIENLEYEHTALCHELLRRTDAADQSLAAQEKK